MEEPRYRGPAYETARLKLARIRVESGDSRAKALLYLLQTSAEVLGAFRACLWLLRDGGRVVHCESQFGSASPIDPSHSLSLNASKSLGDLINNRKLALIPQANLSTLGAFGEAVLSERLDRFVCVPLFRETRAFGLLTFELDSSHPLDERHLSFASSAGDFATLIFEQAERLELEVALQAASVNRAEIEKMHALVRLSRSVAHDLNGLLSIVSAASEELTQTSPNLDELAQDLAHVAELGKNLTDRLLLFGGEPKEGVAVDLDKLVPELAHIIRPLFGGERRFSVSFQTEKAKILADPLAVKRALMNLAKNASEAIGAAGKVELIVREPHPDDPLRVDAIVLEVIDNGIGMDDATQAKATEPYFTTKPNGHGLGLSEVFGIAHRFGGGVRIRSAKDQGTTISVAFPKA